MMRNLTDEERDWGQKTHRAQLVMQGSHAVLPAGGPWNGANPHHLHQKTSFGILGSQHFASR